MSKLHAVILAGGSGTRFWPLSRQSRPKQFLSLFGDRSLIQQSAERVRELIPAERWWVVCGAGHAEQVKDHLPELYEAQLIVEPAARNTAPAIALACLHVLRKDPEAILAILPADHHVSDQAAFRQALETAAKAAQLGAVVTLGVQPTRPETGYGYLELSEAPSEFLGLQDLEQRSFVEKPTLEHAEELLQDGRHLWNAGIFVFQAKTMIAAMERLLPQIIQPLLTLGEDIHIASRLREAFLALESISIDYGVMEALAGVRCVPVACGWSDLGSFQSLSEHFPKDENDSILLGDALAISSSGCLVDARAGSNITLVGVEDLVVIHAGDSLLITRRGQEQSVREAVAALKKSGREELL